MKIEERLLEKRKGMGKEKEGTKRVVVGLGNEQSMLHTSTNIP